MRRTMLLGVLEGKVRLNSILIYVNKILLESIQKVKVVKFIL